ncbi:hypothetical protein GCM10023196_062850 [Actinoallomurus vinaceus]|uniref:Secreted protein n=1 Tax=Actinoallomurus vinaceus TaxID=1080074 RepID=A0ABP8UHY3_9ACTN
MLETRVIGACLLAALALATAGCGGGVDKKACGRLENTLADIRRQAMSQVDDPTHVAQAYTSGAATLRRQAESTDGKLKKSADNAAGALEALGRQVRAAADGTGSGVDSSQLISATTELKRTCGGS